jgi:hypothetical protein
LHCWLAMRGWRLHCSFNAIKSARASRRTNRRPLTFMFYPQSFFWRIIFLILFVCYANSIEATSPPISKKTPQNAVPLWAWWAAHRSYQESLMQCVQIESTIESARNIREVVVSIFGKQNTWRALSIPVFSLPRIVFGHWNSGSYFGFRPPAIFAICLQPASDIGRVPSCGVKSRVRMS